MSCDSECPQYQSAGLCTHTVAAAVHNHKLLPFISSYQHVHHITNITKLAVSETPKGRGRKGGKAKSGKWKATPIEARCELNPSSSDLLPSTNKLSLRSISNNSSLTSSLASLKVLVAVNVSNSS